MSQETGSTGPVTRLLLDWSGGDARARDEMLPLVYDELRRLAASYLFRERPGHTLRPTELVHEAYLRLIDQRQVDWKNRAQFVGLAAVMMRRILVNHARERAAEKRGGHVQKVPLSAADAAGDASTSTSSRCTTRSFGWKRSTRARAASSSSNSSAV